MLIKLIQLSEVRSKTHGWLEAAKGRQGMPAAAPFLSESCRGKQWRRERVREGKHEEGPEHLSVGSCE